MSQRQVDRGSPTIRRVVHDARRAGAAIPGSREFSLGESVRSLTEVRNDGSYPHKDFDETLVQQGDSGVIRESWSFLGEIYYTVDFCDRAAVVIMRGGEIKRAARRPRGGSPDGYVRTRGVGILESAC